MTIDVGATIAISKHRTLSMTERIPTRSGLGARWRAEDFDTKTFFEVFVLEPHHQTHEVVQDCLTGLWGYEHAQGHGADLLILDLDGVQTLEELCTTRTRALKKPPSTADRRAALDEILRQIEAFCELFQLLHEIHERCILHAGSDFFALRTNEQGLLEGIIRRPEALHAKSDLPAPGSFHSLGLDAPEVVGLVTYPLDIRADVYILASIAFALLTGRLLGPQSEQCLEHLPDLRAFDPTIPPHFNLVLRKGLARIPNARYEDPQSFLDALRDALALWDARTHTRLDTLFPIAWCGLTDIGDSKQTRCPVNQDTHLGLFDPKTGWGLFSVLDGVSRSRIGSGEMASWAGAQALEREWYTRRQTPIYGTFFEGSTPFPTNYVRRLARTAQLAVFDQLRTLLAAREPLQDPVSTLCSTLSTLVFCRDRVACVSVGDSPIYLIHPTRDQSAQLVQLNPPHTHRVRGMVRGRTLYEACHAKNAKALHAALGRVIWAGNPPQAMSAELDMFVDSFRIFPGDLLVVASDGVPDALGDDAEDLITRAFTPVVQASSQADDVREFMMRKAASFLIEESNHRGGRDNLTLIVISVGEPS